MTYKIAVCDDNEEYLEMLAEKIKNYKDKDVDFIVHKFNDSDVLMEWIEDKKLFDAYFLDIEMPCYTGIELAKKIRESSDTALITFITAHESFAVEACGINVIRYLLKDQMISEIESLMKELILRFSYIQDEKIYVITNRNRYIKLRQKDIIYLYKHEKNVHFVMVDDREETERISLQEVVDKLDNKDMLWLDRGVVVNLSHVCQVSGMKIKMSRGHEITTNKAHITELKNALDTYWENLL